jgi:hypothetical protein
MRHIEQRLERENPRYRRIWVQYSNHRQLRVVITVFPQGHGNYTMIFGTPSDLSYESINNLLQSKTTEN